GCPVGEVCGERVGPDRSSRGYGRSRQHRSPGPGPRRPGPRTPVGGGDGPLPHERTSMHVPRSSSPRRARPTRAAAALAALALAATGSVAAATTAAATPDVATATATASPNGDAAINGYRNVGSFMSWA